MSSDEANDAAFRDRLLADPRLAPVLSDPARFRAQVLLTEVVETSVAGTEACPQRRHTGLRRHAFRADAEYFYPASTVKLFGAIAACVTLRELARAHSGLDKDTPLAFGARPREASDVGTTENENEIDEITTLRAELAKLFLTSDNRAFNRCFDLCGPSGIRRWTARHVPGEDVRVTHRLFDDVNARDEARDERTKDGSELPEVWAKLIVGARDKKGEKRWVRVLPRRKDECRFEETRASPSKDASYYTIGASVYRAPPHAGDGVSLRDGDFSEQRHSVSVTPGGLDCFAKNRCSLRALQRAALVLARPDLAPLGEDANASEGDVIGGVEGIHPGGGERCTDTRATTTTALHPDDRAFLLRCAASFPRDAAALCGGAADAAYLARAAETPDAFPKFFLPGIRRALRRAAGRDAARYEETVTNKLGRAYGFSVDNAHVRVVRLGDEAGGTDETDDPRDGAAEKTGKTETRSAFREFFLAVAVQTNANGVVNDDAYEYDAVADPFLEAVAEVAATFAWDPDRA